MRGQKGLTDKRIAWRRGLGDAAYDEGGSRIRFPTNVVVSERVL